MKVKEIFSDEQAMNYSDFTREIVRVGEAIEALGYELTDHTYSQGEQFLFFSHGGLILSVSIMEAEDEV